MGVIRYFKVRGKDGRNYHFEAIDWDGEGSDPPDKKVRCSKETFESYLKEPATYNKSVDKDGNVIAYSYRFAVDLPVKSNKGCIWIMIICFITIFATCVAII